MDQSKSDAEPRMLFVVVPQGERVKRHERNLRALERGDRCAADERILVRVTASHTPLRCHKAIQADFVTIRTLATSLQNSRWVIRIRRAGVGAILPVERGREREVTTYVPLRSEFVIRELLRFNLLRDRRQL